VADAGVELVASFFTLTGGGFVDPPRHGFVERCRAAAGAGFTGIGMHAADLPRTVENGLDAGGMRAVLADTGLRVVEIEFLGGWAFDEAGDEVVAGIEAVADALGGRHVSAGEFRPMPERGPDRDGPGRDGPDPGLLDLDGAAARLGALAARLDERGLLVALEAFPWSALPDVDTACALLSRAGAGNAGLMIDVWHFFNGGARPELLAGRPAGTVTAVQLNDGPLVHEDFLRHARAQRRLPGEGDLDVVGLIQAVRDTGFDGPWCIEVNTPEHNALPASEAAKRAAGAALEVLDTARG
jgi:sugar phosphate isomerase/epimerase